MANNLDINKFTPLSTVVSMFLDEKNRSYADFRKCWTLAFRALQKVNQQFAALPKSIKIPVDPNMTAQLPPDYISWSKIGIMDADGQISTLKINTALTTYRDQSPNRLNYLQPDINTSFGTLVGSPFFFNFYGNGIYYNTPLFGAQGGFLQYGECNVDERNKVIILPPDFKYQSIILEYISAPERDKDYAVETVLVEAVISFIAWKMNLGPREEFYANCVEARRTMPNKRVTLQNINEVIRQTTGMYLKA